MRHGFMGSSDHKATSPAVAQTPQHVQFHTNDNANGDTDFLSHLPQPAT